MVKIEEIYSKNKKLMDEIILYVLKTYNISIKVLLEDSKYYTRQVLKDIRSNNIKVCILRARKDRASKDLDDFNKAFVTGDSYDTTGAGYSKGGLQKNRVEERQIKKQELREKLQGLIYEAMELESSLAKTNKLIEEYINLIPNRDYREAMRLTYIECMADREISSVIFYEQNSIKVMRKRSIDRLTELMTLAAENQAKKQKC